MSSPSLMFGGCGCGRNVTGGIESQNVTAWVPFGMGVIGVTQLVQTPSSPVPTNNPVANPFGDEFTDGNPNGQVPGLIYLTLTTQYFDEYSGQNFGSLTQNWDKYGNLTTTQSGTSTIDYEAQTGHGYFTQYSASNPYTYSEAVQHALTLLDLVTLLDPTTVYQVLWPIGSSGLSQTLPTNFCYGSEAAAYANPASTLYISWDNSGNPVLTVTQPNGAFNIGAGCANGYVANIMGGPNGYMWPNIQVGKSAVRTPVGFQSVTLVSFTPVIPATPFAAPVALSQQVPWTGYTSIIEPAILPPGEYIFTPSEAPQWGYANWSTDPATNLPAAKTTADSTSTTADSTTQTADTQ